MEEEEEDALIPSPPHLGNLAAWGSLFVVADEASIPAALSEASGGMGEDGWCCLMSGTSWRMAQEKRQNPGEWQGTIRILIT